MLINYSNSETYHVEFVSYSGRYPNLCSGVLVLRIDGLAYGFGHEVGSYDFNTNKFKDHNCEPFWHSGGGIQADENWNIDVRHGEWVINADEIPEEFRKYATEIDRVFNGNVPFGCCGGCS